MSLFISCKRDDAELDPTLNWKAETIVDENEVIATGVSNWFKTEEISNEIFYVSLVTDLSNGVPLEESLKRKARRTIHNMTRIQS